MFAPVALFLFLSVGAVALFSFVAIASWSDARRREREAYYKSEVLKKIAETSGSGANSALELIREQEKIAIRRRREGMKLGGLITAAVGIGLMFLFNAKAHPYDPGVPFIGMIPLLVGAALLVYVYALAPKEL
ncbi:MAG: hypothetical protein ABSD20_10275 [Terriglobales bacterium]|jgi:hypothetical protein